jgi:hypothetical protein
MSFFEDPNSKLSSVLTLRDFLRQTWWTSTGAALRTAVAARRRASGQHDTRRFAAGENEALPPVSHLQAASFVYS